MDIKEALRHISSLRETYTFAPRHEDSLDKLCAVAINYGALEENNMLLKRECDIMARRLANELHIPISSVRGQVLYEIDNKYKIEEAD